MGGTPPPFAENSAKIIDLIFATFPKYYFTSNTTHQDNLVLLSLALLDSSLVMHYVTWIHTGCFKKKGLIVFRLFLSP